MPEKSRASKTAKKFHLVGARKGGYKLMSVSTERWHIVNIGILLVKLRRSGGCFNIKMSSFQYRDPHVKDKTVTTVLSLTWESPYLGKTVFILRQGPGDCLTRCLANLGVIRQFQTEFSRVRDFAKFRIICLHRCWTAHGSSALG